MIEIHGYHGWGFDGSFWDELKKEFPDTILFKAADRGYFGGEFIPEFNPKSTFKIIFTHSYGLHWCPNEMLQHADLIVSFNGFDKFLPTEFLEKRREQKILKRMVQQFKVAPKQVLEAFYVNCFSPSKPVVKAPNWMNNSKLINDLKNLRNCSLALNGVNPEKWVIIAAEKDLIVPFSINSKLADRLKAKNFKVFERTGHALPIVNSKDCWSFLISVLPIFEQHAKEDRSE